MKRMFFGIAILAFSSTFALVAAQERDMGPPPVLLIVREDIKPGKMPAHNRHSASYARIFNQMQTANHRLAMVPVAGSENEVIYITAAGTFAEVEKMAQETDRKMGAATGNTKMDLDRLDKEAADLHAGMRDMMAIYRSEMSYDPGVDIAKMRYFAITTVRIRPGMEDTYIDYIRNLTNVAREKAKAELHIAAYQVIAGSTAAPGATYMFFRPMKSMSDYDLRIGARVRAAMSDEQKKKADKTVGETVLNSETSVYAFTPQMSYMPKEFVARDAGFWGPKSDSTAVAPRTTRKKPTKPAAATATTQQ